MTGAESDVVICDTIWSVCELISAFVSHMIDVTQTLVIKTKGEKWSYFIDHYLHIASGQRRIMTNIYIFLIPLELKLKMFEVHII